MSTRGSLIITDSYDNEVLLYTTQNGMDIPDWVRESPEVIAKQRSYLKTAKQAKTTLPRDGSIRDLLFYAPRTAALIIAACPTCLYPVKKLSDDEPYRLHLDKDNGTWTLKCEYENLDSEIVKIHEVIDIADAFGKICEKINGNPTITYLYENLGLRIDDVLPCELGSGSKQPVILTGAYGNGQISLSQKSDCGKYGSVKMMKLKDFEKRLKEINNKHH